MKTRSAILGALCVLAMAAPAAAHVSVDPASAAKGSFATLTVRVPNERDDSGTNKVELTLPTDKPLGSVRVKADPLWTVATEKNSAGAVTKITWSGGAIKPGEFYEFRISAGPLPKDVDKVVFRAVQTYQNGEVVRWIEEAAAGGAEPEHPAPVLTLTDAAAAADDHHAAGSDSATATTAAAASAGDEHEDEDHDDHVLPIIALVVGALGLIAGVTALAKPRRTP